MNVIVSHDKIEFNYTLKTIARLIFLLLMIWIGMDCIYDIGNSSDINIDFVFFDIILVLILIIDSIHDYNLLMYKIYVDCKRIHEKSLFFRTKTIFWSELTSCYVKSAAKGRSNTYCRIIFEGHSFGKEQRIKVASMSVHKYNKFKNELYELCKKYCTKGITEYDCFFI